MPTYDWPLIQQRSGDSIESLIATLLRREYTDARQVNPSQGDGGIDILRSTDDGLEIWQVKGFTTAMTDSQFRQVKKSWERLVEEHVTPGKHQIFRYHLVTPWTPTEERITLFDELTADASFSCQWDSDAFIAGLADRYPETMQRFVHGEGVLEQFISQKAMLASSPVERGESLTMLDAIETRQDALDVIRDTVSENYRIEHGTRTAANAHDVPLPSDDDPAVYHRMTYLGDARWKYESVVPRSVDAVEIDPIILNMEFLAAPGTPEHDAVRAWSEWGIPFQGAHVRTTTVGGPFSDDEPAESTVSFIERGRDDAPPLYLRCITSDGESRFRLPLVVAARTVGTHTGWLRLVADTPERALNFELRFKQGEDTDAKVQMGNVDGRNPEAVRDELETLLSISEGDVISVETSNGQSLIRTHGTVLPTALEAIHLPVAQHLVQLQAHTAAVLVMPSIEEITDGQFRYLSLLASIYGGTAHRWNWAEVTLRVPEDPAEALRIKEVAANVASGGHLVKVEEPVFQLGNRTYTIDHPLASTAHSVQFEAGIDPAALHPGDTFRLIPGADAGVTTAKIVDWTPGSISFD
ncbi:hypothetical protein [Brachybacterium saurashtrense]|uniref:Restriction endonuclease type IV Mrr domain-containing protein n=1 Tax=Brachybacterium saurashtrense TaxID=556288 RepID=A0A345YSY3_9MICO|nr:hypothetical protein [Brachybacterium saurashtrense]AXK47035.1 hypothetical protein DWV08_16355 [Brachybacterium saurashtrense]RRR20884.1 hypothetical protein DXU92_16250 [Brachybacterium saurashtrense]